MFQFISAENIHPLRSVHLASSRSTFYGPYHKPTSSPHLLIILIHRTTQSSALCTTPYNLHSHFPISSFQTPFIISKISHPQTNLPILTFYLDSETLCSKVHCQIYNWSRGTVLVHKAYVNPLTYSSTYRQAYSVERFPADTVLCVCPGTKTSSSLVTITFSSTFSNTGKRLTSPYNLQFSI